MSSPKRRLLASTIVTGWAAACLVCAGPVHGQDAEESARALVMELRARWPTENVVQTGWLVVRDRNGNRTAYRLRCEVAISPTNWVSIFEAFPTNTQLAGTVERLSVLHSADCPGQYNWCYSAGAGAPSTGAEPQQQFSWAGTRWPYAFAGSDFWAVDLGLEFLCWPGQRLLKKELRRSRACHVLESVNPVPAPDGYLRVVSWVDIETGGIVRAEAYDANNRLLKEFEPKEFKKFKGRWELRQMRIRNVQTGSQTVVELDQPTG